MPTPAQYQRNETNMHSIDKNGYILFKFMPFKASWEDSQRLEQTFVLSGAEITKVNQLDPRRLRYKEGRGPSIRPEYIFMSSADRFNQGLTNLIEIAE